MKPSRLIIADVAALTVATVLLLLPERDMPAAPFDPVALVEVPGGTVEYRPFGSFSRGGRVDAPGPVPLEVRAFEIMKYQVSREQYAACVSAGACSEVPAAGTGVPQTQVNWQDATDFALWYSRLTGQTWRLPTAMEWQHAAAERYADANVDPGDLDPGERMLANYKAGVLLRGTASPALRPTGSFGVNSRGVGDMGGNVWEWTDSCMERGSLNDDGSIAESEPYCWVRIAGGMHRAAIVDIVRDASVGGCAVGLPPDHLGFRLVRSRD
ncbi:formylglycine-generating enzyme family protein [Alloyangia pacifica]|uniref:formylglycine-generating enzyme family protein n=1 Tax=Alloyangia pacifica TaxID=311180 RepID=UPI0031E259D5